MNSDRDDRDRIQLFYIFSEERYNTSSKKEKPDFKDLSVTINNSDYLFKNEDYEIVKSDKEGSTYKFQKKQ